MRIRNPETAGGPGTNRHETTRGRVDGDDEMSGRERGSLLASGRCSPAHAL